MSPHCPPPAAAPMLTTSTHYKEQDSNLPQANINIAALNINSITASGKLQELTHFVNDHEVSIVALSELKIDSTVHPSLYCLDQFHPPVTKIRTRKGGGVGIYIRDSLPFSHLPHLENDEFETTWAKIKIYKFTLIICCCYLPPQINAEKLTAFLDYLSDSVSEAQRLLPDAIIVAGDLNAGNCWLPLESTKHSPITSFELNLKTTSETLSLSQLIRTATRIQHDTYNIRDLIFINREDIVIDSGILPPFSTLDHLPTFLALSLQRPSIDHGTVKTIWDYKSTNIEAFVQTLSGTRWDLIVEKDVDEAVSALTTTILEAASQWIPTKQIAFKKNKPWFTSELRREMRKRDRLFKIAKRSQRVPDWTRWRHQRNLVTSINRRLKNENVKIKVSKLLETKSDPFKYHSTLKNITGFKRSNVMPPLIVNDHILSGDAEKASVLNSYFCEQTDITVTQRNIEHLRWYTSGHPVTPHVLEFEEISSREVLKAINNLDSSKACGPDKLPAKMLKMTAAFIAEPLSKILNKSIIEGRYPSLWKKATVKPVFKGKGSPSELKNYRPISLLPCMSKIFEKLIFSRIYEHINQHSLLTQKQSGYRPGHNTQIQLTYLTDKLYKALDEGQDFTIIYLDISRYFEKIWHEGLLAKCSSEFGIRGNLLNWLKCYLSGRQQTVQVGSKNSPIESLKAGVPQGSVLGPLLAILYLNGLSTLTENDMMFFADDSSLHAYHTPSNLGEVESRLQKDLDSILNYGQKWVITFNASKTTQQTFSHKPSVSPPSLNFDSVQIPQSNSHKHLGLTISTDLKFKTHIQEILLKFNRTLSPLYPLADLLPRHTIQNIYQMYVQPHLDYCDSIYHNHLTKFDRSRLEKAQKRAARLITGVPRRTSTTELLGELGWISLEKRRESNKILLYQKIKCDNKVPQYIKACVPNARQEQTPRQLRSASNNHLSNPRFNTHSYRNSFFPSTTKMWNELPTELRQINSQKQFRKQLSQLKSPASPNPYFSFGTRLGNKVHTQLRLSSSSLNAHKYSQGKTDSPACTCGYPREDTKHFLLSCPLFNDIRTVLFRDLDTLLRTNFQSLPVSTQCKILIMGPDQGHPSSKPIANSVQRFILRTCRLHRNANLQ